MKEPRLSFLLWMATISSPRSSVESVLLIGMGSWVVGERRALTDTKSITIGGAADCELVIPHRVASRHHCKITVASDRYEIVDLNSTNGTYVDGVRISLPTAVAVARTSAIRLGYSIDIPWPFAIAGDADWSALVGLGSDGKLALEGSAPTFTPFARLILAGRLAILQASESGSALNVKSAATPWIVASAAAIFPDTAIRADDREFTGADFYALVPAIRPALESTITFTTKTQQPSTPRDLLVSLGIISTSDWDAVVGAPSSGELPAVLDALEEGPAAWSTAEKPSPRITPYQREEILTGRGEGLRLGDYLLLSPLNKGGMGAVYRARDLKANRYAAIKVLAENMTSAGDEGAVYRFQREMKILKRLRHPGICEFYDAGEAHGRQYLAMELLEGQDFAAMVQDATEANFQPDVDSVVVFARQIADALQYLHDNGIVHRDIKPGNIFLTDDGAVKLLDVGIARLYETVGPSVVSFADSITQAGVALGTPEYMAAEQWMDAKDVGPASDIYSLGCTLYCILTGQPPFFGSLEQLARRHIESAPPRLSKQRADIPEWLDAIVAKMLAKSPGDRYQSMRDFIADIDRARRPVWRKLFGSFLGGK